MLACRAASRPVPHGDYARTAGRHPACCGARLDQDSRRRPAGPGLIALQDKILGLLDPGGPAATLSAGMPAPPASYFSDLRALALLACSTWPAARHLSPGEDAASAIDQHIDSLRQQAAARHAGSPPDASRTRLDFSFPPADAAASGGLAHIADRILAGSRDDVREQLLLLLPFGTRKRRPEPLGPQHDPDGDPVLRGPAGRLRSRPADLHQDRRPPGPARRCPPPWALGTGEHPGFPARRLVRPPLHADRRRQRPVHPADSGAPARPDGRRRLPQRCRRSFWESHQPAPPGPATASTPEQATSTPAPGSNTAPSASRTRWKPSHANSTTRQRHWSTTSPGDRPCRTWCIDKDTWTSLTARLPPVPGPQQPDLGDRKRQLASIYVWVQVTSGEHLFAPRPIEAIMPPSLRKPWTQWTSAWKLLDPGHPGPHYTSLKAELGTIAASLARTIDNHC